MLKETGLPIHHPPHHHELPVYDLQADNGRVKGKALFADDSIWFQGHFPAVKILPCVAVTAIAVEPLLRHAKSQGRLLKVVSFTRVRIKRMIFPDEELFITIDDMPAEDVAEINFEVSCKGEKICQGRALMADK